MTIPQAYIYLPSLLGYSKLSSILRNLSGGKMARLSFCLCTLLLLLSFSVSESRPVLNRDPFSFHFPSNFLFRKTVKHYFYPGSKERSLAKIHKRLNTSAKVSFSIEFRNNATRSGQYYQPRRVSPGGPDGHHHFKVTDSGGHERRQINCNERNNKNPFIDDRIML